MRKNNLIRERIIEVLLEHPEGLPIFEIAILIGAHRHTVTKYIYEFAGAGIIQIREIGTAKLCFLKQEFVRKVKTEDILEKMKNETKERLYVT
ncbi:MAG: hypothetical protein ACTSVB_02020 [Candidatus Heimdallarchaeaceae archaeon]